MSQQNSESLFDSVDFQAAEPTEGYDPTEEVVFAAAPVHRKRSFDAYSMMLILSFICLTAAAVILFMDAAKY